MSGPIFAADLSYDVPSSPASSDSSFDEDDVNRRVTPYWQKYRCVFKSRGLQLDTVRDVKLFYQRHSKEETVTSRLFYPKPFSECRGEQGFIDDDALCPDAGLPDNLFRGTRVCDQKKFVAKAVHIYSREYDVIRLLSQPPLKQNPMNHTIPVLDLFDIHEDQIAFIVMEEWSSQLIPDSGPCCLRLFLASLRQCIEHALFMHMHHIAHLDISLRNLLTDYEGHYAYIDYELSRRFDGVLNPLVQGYRGTEIPPECERGECSDPYKIDIWALGVLVLRACKLTGHNVPELMQLIRPMLHEEPRHRPPLISVLRAFDRMVLSIGDFRLNATCSCSH